MKKFSKKRSLSARLINIAALAEMVTLLTVGSVSYLNANNYINNHQEYNVDEIINQINIYGGDSRYIDQSKNIFLAGNNPIVSHLEERKMPYIIGFSSEISENDKTQLEYVVKYFNELFEVINPNYKFETKVCKESECDIFIIYDNLPEMINANVTVERHYINTSKIESAIVRFNCVSEMDNATKRISFAHEMMHILYGSDDVDYTKSKTFSVYNYDDSTFMSQMIEGSKEPPYASLVDTPYYMTKEKKDSFISLTPTDVGTLIAIYGDSSDPQKKCEYIKLLEKTVFECSKVYGEYQPYFEKDYELPDCGICK